MHRIYLYHLPSMQETEPLGFYAEGASSLL